MKGATDELHVRRPVCDSAMKQLTFAVPNSVTKVLYEIENLRHVGKLSVLGCRLLEMFYVTGWDDGFVQFNRRDVATALAASPAELDGAIDELGALCLVNFRMADRWQVAEIVALSTPALSGMTEMCWWQYYRVEFADFWFDLGEKNGDN